MKNGKKLSICQLCFAHQIRQLTEHRRKTLYGFIGGFFGISKLGHHYTGCFFFTGPPLKSLSMENLGYVRLGVSRTL